ncbi:MAG: hypothetical protein H8F28_25190 [Fibrella sp.]|nr:hypothetical protein [Armatimonadota bacterium]
MKRFAVGIIVSVAAVIAGGSWMLAPEPARVVAAAVAKKKSEKPVAKLLTNAERAEYQTAIERTQAMVNDTSLKNLAQKHGLDVLNITWEDTGRYKGSSVGPNISDMTIQVASRDASEKLSVACMPVIRKPNFADETCDLDPKAFTLLVGNAKGRNLRRVSLHDFLLSPAQYLSKPESWAGRQSKTLLAPSRDSKVLVSAQACFLPIPKGGLATFNPVLFNYQSSRQNPAVLTILATREGTSATIIDNSRDAFETGAVWGQRLFHNANGARASLTGQRESNFVGGKGDAPHVGNPKARKPESGLNMVLLVQVPLKHRDVLRGMDTVLAFGAQDGESRRYATKQESNVENAVIGHGDLEGPFSEIDSLPIERDPRFPVRVTVQFYKATDNGVASEKDLQAVREQIDRVYNQSDYVGSLVTQGKTGRITEYEGAKLQPTWWWETFWRKQEMETGKSQEQIRAELRQLLGRNYQHEPATEMYLRDRLRDR